MGILILAISEFESMKKILALLTPGTKFNYTQSKDSDDLIQAFPMLYSIVTVELYVSSITSYFVILIAHKLLYWSNLILHLPVKAALAIGKKS